MFSVSKNELIIRVLRFSSSKNESNVLIINEIPNEIENGIGSNRIKINLGSNHSQIGILGFQKGIVFHRSRLNLTRTHEDMSFIWPETG